MLLNRRILPLYQTLACMHACIILYYIWICLKKYWRLWPDNVHIKLQCTELVLIPHECCYLHWYPTAKVFRARVLRKSKISLQPMHLPLTQMCGGYFHTRLSHCSLDFQSEWSSCEKMSFLCLLHAPNTFELSCIFFTYKHVISALSLMNTIAVHVLKVPNCHNDV